MGQILMPRAKKDQLTAIGQALGIAGGVLGIKNALDAQAKIAAQTEQAQAGAELAKGQVEEQRARQQGRITPMLRQKLAQEGFQEIPREQVEKMPPGARNFVEFLQPVRDEATGKEIGTRPVYLAKIEQKKPVSQLESLKIGSEKLKQKKLKQELAGDVTPKDIKKERATVSKQLGSANIPELTKVMQNIDNKLVKIGFKQGIDTRDLKKDLPGFGMTGYTPARLLSDEGRELRQLVSGLRNAVLKMRSGGAVTPEEGQRLMEEIEGAKTDEDLLRGLSNFRDTMQAAVENVFAGVSEKGEKAFMKRGGLSRNMAIFSRNVKPQQIAQENKGSQGGGFLDAVDNIIGEMEGVASNQIPLRPPGS